MDSTTYLIAKGASEQPEAQIIGRRLALRGRCRPELVDRFVDELCRYWRHDGKPAIVSTATTSSGCWACIARIDAREADGDHLDQVALATCLLFGIDWKDGTPAFMRLLYQDEFRAACWRSLTAGEAGPELVAAVLTA